MTKKLNNFYIFLFLTLVVVAVLVVFTFRSIFEAVSVSYEIDNVVADTELKIDRVVLNKAYSTFFEREIEELNIKSEPVIISDEVPEENK